MLGITLKAQTPAQTASPLFLSMPAQEKKIPFFAFLALLLILKLLQKQAAALARLQRERVAGEEKWAGIELLPA